MHWNDSFLCLDTSFSTGINAHLQVRNFQISHLRISVSLVNRDVLLINMYFRRQLCISTAFIHLNIISYVISYLLRWSTDFLWLDRQGILNFIRLCLDTSLHSNVLTGSLRKIRSNGSRVLGRGVLFLHVTVFSDCSLIFMGHKFCHFCHFENSFK